MILTDDEALAIVKKNSSKEPDWVTKARLYSKELFALVEGEDFDDLLIKHIEHIESKKKAEVRKKFARNIVDLFERLMLPISNVFSASGSTKKYELKDEAKITDLLKALSTIKDGKSIEKYVETTWMPLYHTDPNGIIFMEYVTEPDPKVWSTYKSIKRIRNYVPKGQGLEWLLFEFKKHETNDGVKVWRIVDDKRDITINQTGTDVFTISEDPKETFEHPFGEVPAIINSDIVDIQTGIRLSPLHKVIALTKEYARDQSVKTLYKFLHGFPIHWRIVTQCKGCVGTKKVDGKTCPDCNGHGFYNSKDVSDIVNVQAPKTKDEQKIVPEIAGYIAPDLDTWNQYTAELKLLDILTQDTHWGTHVEEAGNETATGRFIDIQPVINKLNRYADVAQHVEWKITEYTANFVLPDKAKDESVSQIVYGRYYIIDSPDTILERYTKAKEKGENVTVLDRMFQEYITAKYKNDTQWLRVELFKSKIEPYVHQTLKDVAEIFGSEEALKKVYFKEWWDEFGEDLVMEKPTDAKKKFNDAFNTHKSTVNINPNPKTNEDE